MKYYHRENYLHKIRGFYHITDIIKVITGVRRCGKSCLMSTIEEELLSNGVTEEQIIYIDLDDRKYRKIKDADSLEALIDSKVITDQVKYLFIDEIQNVDGFEELINGYRGEGDFSIFITGSNSYLLSGELVTKLTGRYLEFEMFPLTFEEYLGMKAFLGKDINADLTSELDAYILEGGFPGMLSLNTPAERRMYVEGIITEIFEKDIKGRVKVKNVSAFQQIQTYMINNFGSTVSLTNILDDLHKNGMNIRRETLNKYIQILMDAKILYKCTRFDLKSRRSIGGEQKYYLADLSFYFAPNTDNRINYGPVLENCTYLYARSKGYKVSVGRIGKFECDFIVRDMWNNYAYIQVAMTIQNSRETEEREYRPLEQIRDNYPKYVITRNDLIQKRNGIHHVNIGQFMKDGKLFTGEQ